jgi:hypothetical protein
LRDYGRRRRNGGALLDEAAEGGLQSGDAQLQGADPPGPDDGYDRQDDQDDQHEQQQRDEYGHGT